MNNVQSPALLRSLIVYAICVPLAIVVGYAVVNFSNYGDKSSMWMIGFLAAILIFPLLIKWHYPVLVFGWAFPISLFFLPGHANLFLPMVAASLTISIIERILNKEKHFLPAGGVQWPLLALLAVVFITAKLTGGFGLRSMGSDVYGGKKYVFLIAGILSFFALIARPIPKKHANLYITLYFAGMAFNFITDIAAWIPGPMRFIYAIFPMSNTGIDAMGNMNAQFGVTRLGGIALTASAIYYWLLARHGVRNLLFTAKLWRPLLLGFSFLLMFAGGYRSNIMAALLVFGVIFYLEKLHRTGLMLVMVLAGVLMAALLVPMASHLPYTFQRALAWLPLDLNPEVRMDTEGSSQWRVDMWTALLPEVPKYLLLGKGYAFSAETFNESMGQNAMFQKTIDAAENPLALSSDFHSGPLSVVLSFGIWGVLAWLWFWAAGFRVLWRNYHHGDPAVRHFNLFLFAWYVSKCFMFLFIFGGIVEDIASFALIIGLSIAMNRGVMSPKPQEKRVPSTAKPPLAISGQPAFQR